MPVSRSNDAVEAQVEQLCKLCWASALEAWDLDLGFRVEELGLGFRVKGFRFRVWELGFRI